MIPFNPRTSTRVLNVLQDERIGGPQLRVAAIAARLQPRGVITVVVMPAGDNEFSGLLERAGIPYRQIRMRRIRDSKDPRLQLDFLFSFGPTVARLVRIIRQERIDIVHVNGITNLSPAVAAKLAGAKLVWHLNDIYTPPVVARALRPLVSAWSDAIAVSARAVADYYWPKGAPPKIVVQYAPVDTERFCPAAPIAALPPELPTDASPIIGTIGNLNPYKGHDLLISAFAIVASRHRKAQLVLVGADLGNRKEYSRRLRALATRLGVSDRVWFLGKQTDVPGILARCTVYAHASLTEACPIAVLEAMAAGKPIVAASVGGVPELIEDGMSGLLVPPGNARALAGALLRLLDAPNEGREYGRRARERAVAAFDAERCAHTHAVMYTGLTRLPECRPLGAGGSDTGPVA